MIGRLDPQPASQNRVVYRKGLIEARFDPLDVDAYQIVVLVKDTGDEAGSPPLEVRDGRLRLPWFVIDSSGPHEIDIYALDRNLFDFVRSIPQGDTGFGIGSLAGDNFERPIFHLDGGSVFSVPHRWIHSNSWYYLKTGSHDFPAHPHFFAGRFDIPPPVGYLQVPCRH